MSYDEALADRVRSSLDGQAGVSEKRMFGGLAFLVDGHMAVAANNAGGLLVRVPPEQTDELVAQPGASRFAMRGREMAGWLGVEAAAVTDDDALVRWVRRGVAYTQSLPPR